MNYYKKIELKNFDVIQKKSIDFLKVHHPRVYTRETNSTSNFISVTEYIQHCPEVSAAFSEYNLVPTFLSVFVMNSNQDCPIHIDYYASATLRNTARINLPILNCDNTYTNFWRGGDPWVFVQQHPPRGSFYRNTTNDFTFVDRVCIDSPTVIRVDQPHSVTLNSTVIPRITFTIGFDRDPVFLLDNN